MLHIIGGVCVIVGSAVIGLQAVGARRKRLEELRQFISACRLMERELSCREPDMCCLLEQLLRRTKGTVQCFFAACHNEMNDLGKRTFEEIWCQNLKQSHLHNQQQERELLLELGAVLGKYDREAQCVALKETTAELELLMQQGQGEAQKQNKLCMTLSIAGGMLLVVLAC